MAFKRSGVRFPPAPPRDPALDLRPCARSGLFSGLIATCSGARPPPPHHGGMRLVQSADRPASPASPAGPRGPRSRGGTEPRDVPELPRGTTRPDREALRPRRLTPDPPNSQAKAVAVSAATAASASRSRRVRREPAASGARGASRGCRAASATSRSPPTAARRGARARPRRRAPASRPRAAISPATAWNSVAVVPGSTTSTSTPVPRSSAQSRFAEQSRRTPCSPRRSRAAASAASRRASR